MASARANEEAEEEAFSDAEEQFEQEGAPGDRAQAAYTGSYPLHRAAYYNDAARIRALAPTLTSDQLLEQDPHGNTALHVAALRRSTAAVEALLAAGAPVGAKSSRGWTALDEALAARDHATARALHAARLAAARLEMKARRRELLARMREMPDYTMRLSWRLGSPVPGLGALLRRYAPADTYTVWKVGDRLRVDGTLMGIDASAGGLIPEWKRGHFSLVMDGSGAGSGSGGGGDGSGGGGGSGGAAGTGNGATGTTSGGSGAPRLLFLHHGKQRWVDLGADKKAMKAEEQAAVEEELLAALEGDVDKQRFKARGFAFRPVRGWLGGEQRERVEGWDCAVYEASGRLVGVSTSKAAWGLAQTSPFEDYLSMAPRGDGVREVAFDPLSPSTYDPVAAARRQQDEAEEEDGDEEDEEGEDAALEAALRAEFGMGEEEEEEEEDDGAPSDARRGGGGGRSWWWGGGGKEDAEDAEEHFSDASPEPCSSSSDGRPSSSERAAAGGRASKEGSHSKHAAAAAKQQRGGKKKSKDSGSGSKKSKTGSSSKKASGGRTLRARLWMARGFPMRLSQLLPLLEVVGASANRQIAKVASFMRRYAEMDLFPVRVHVPLLLTVYASVSFSGFEALGTTTTSTTGGGTGGGGGGRGGGGRGGSGSEGGHGGKGGPSPSPSSSPTPPPPPEFFEVPPGYQRRLLPDMLDKHAGGLLGAGPGGGFGGGAGRGRGGRRGDEDEGGLFGGDFDWM